MWDWMDSVGSTLTRTQARIVMSILGLGGLWLLNQIGRRAIARIQHDVTQRYTWRKMSNYVMYVLGLLVLGFIWADRISSLATFLGLLSAGLAIAFRDLIMNLAGWYFIIIEKPFKLGDRIQIGDKTGDVVDIRLLQFTLVEIGEWVDAEQSTGRILHIPNARVFNTDVANYNMGLNYIWHELPIIVTFESDWEKAKNLLLNILTAHAPAISEQAAEELNNSSGKFLIVFHKLTPIVYTSLADNGVKLTMRFLTKPKQRRSSEQLIYEAMLRTFAEHKDIQLAYTTRRMVHD